ncbi:MAG: phospho-N-acetylmuramoyl-pentapeptide-transferase [Clostridiales bacterium]|nr:phospho-N-acetylmuramoyl-pentapeptide-transferase [Clostridiales bacterium]
MKTQILCFIISSLITLIVGLAFLPFLKKLKLKQPILKYVDEHKSKSGTPTMGGLFFIVGAIFTFLIFNKDSGKLSNLTIAITLGFMVVGFIDDFLKIKYKHNEGLSVVQKLLFQVIVSIIASYFSYRSGLDFLYLPFSKKTISLGAYVVILNVFVFIATVNSVNLTDGLDGLCSSVSLIIFIALAVIISLQSRAYGERYINQGEYSSLALLSTCFAGGLLGFLLLNTNRASIFMGDTGSLSLGGAISTLAVLSGNTLLIPIVGICYITSSVSVIIQVAYYKKTKKRVFLMAPIHHHFQEKGYSESKIAYAYSFITIILSLSIIIVFM